MRKRFVAKKRKKRSFKLLKFVGIMISIYVIYQIASSLLVKVKLTTNNEDFLLAMMKDSNHHILYEKDRHSFLTKVTQMLTGIDIKHPTTILETVFPYRLESKNQQSLLVNHSKIEMIENEQKVSQETEYIKNPNEKQDGDIQVYLYNTHQLENYSMKNLEPYNITPNVMMATYLLEEKLNKSGIKTIAEETNINEFMKLNHWTSKDTYKASKQFMKQMLTKYPDIDLLIDIHRDAISKNASTITINGKDYAKVLFVIGLNNPNYQKNMEISQNISNLINQKYPKLSRGILQKKGAGVNGVYNQDVSGNAILIECGGYENTIDEVSNTVEVLATVIKEYLEGKIEKGR